MTRTLKRPMFRMGGSTNSGITSGLDCNQENNITKEDVFKNYLKKEKKCLIRQCLKNEVVLCQDLFLLF